MKCPICGNPGKLNSPDYGRGALFRCYNSIHTWGEYSWVDDSDEAKQESNNARSVSYAYALLLKEQK